MSLDTTIKDKLITQSFEQGKADAISLRNRAPELDGTEIIAEERKIPLFDGTKNYIAWAAGSPVRELVDGEYQVFKLLQPHNAANYPGSTPSNAPALWSICHTKEPANAKPYRAANGTSGMYMIGECCTEGGKVYRSKVDNGVYAPSEYAQNWELLEE